MQTLDKCVELYTAGVSPQLSRALVAALSADGSTQGQSFPKPLEFDHLNTEWRTHKPPALRIGVFALSEVDIEQIAQLLAFKRSFPESTLLGIACGLPVSSEALFASKLCDRVVDEASALPGLISATHYVLRNEPYQPRPAFVLGGSVFRSAESQKSLVEGLLAAHVRLPAFISGPTGSGKEVLAHLIHRTSSCASGKFLAVNCAAIPPDLFDAYLFGHTKGAFSGAIADSAGLVEAANGGTLFLDEIGELPLELQAKLNRYLDTGEYRCVGSTEIKRSDAFVISATHQNLEQLTLKGHFNAGLADRIARLVVTLEPLRNRPLDIAPLVWHVLLRLFKKNDPKTWKAISKKSLSMLCAHSWTGNVRELENTINNAALLSQSPYLSERILEQLILRHTHFDPDSSTHEHDKLDNKMHEYFFTLLEICDGCVAKAAQIANTSRTDFYRLLRRYG